MEHQTDAAKIGTAFALVTLAGLCAPAGACVVLFLRKSHTHLLAASIALAAGVMLFVSLTEVLGDSIEQVASASFKQPLVKTISYAAFFAGVLLCSGLEWLTDALMHLVSRYRSRKSASSDSLDTLPATSAEAATPPPASRRQGSKCDVEAGPAPVLVTAGSIELCDAEAGMPEDAIDTAVMEAATQLSDSDCGHLVRTCVLVWLALSLHNLPEGLATFVGYMSSPHLGITVAVAIAIHNIPEGIALGVPIFFATGSKAKAIGWTAVSGLAEPLGALIGLACQLGGALNPVAMGIIMALVAGVMTGIALHELLPRALSFDPSNRFTTVGVFTGMGVMAASLVLLSLLDPSA